MFEWVWLIPMLPMAACGAILLGGRRWSAPAVSLLGVAPAGLSAAVAIAIAARFVAAPPQVGAYTQTLWSWIAAGGLNLPVAFYLDPLAVAMTTVIAVVSFLILLYSTGYMRGDDGYGRFFAYMNLFVASMHVLVLADNLALFYLGWEGVGLCSYLLISFWHRNPANVRAGRKAFLVTRIGDTALLVGILLLFTNLGAMNFQELLHRGAAAWPAGSALATAAAALLLAGAIGKSAQLPLHVWLPDAMAGPTPTSALIHAATMVTAGVYLLARTHALFALAPAVSLLVAIIGTATLLYGGLCALAQRDIKRVLAYSTISQVGYMFLALGVGAAGAAIFHFVTHAFFKSLLFLSAGAVILALHHEQDLYKMGGLRKSMPLAFWTFLIGAASLSAVPLVTAGAFSKDAILVATLALGPGGEWFWAAGVLGALLTALYSFRVVFMAFFGQAKQSPARVTTAPMAAAMIVLALLALLGGYVNSPSATLHWPALERFLAPTLERAGATVPDAQTRTVTSIGAAAAVAAGIALAYALFLRWPQVVKKRLFTPAGYAVRTFFLSGCGFDWLYVRLAVKPWNAAANFVRNDIFTMITTAAVWLAQVAYVGLSLTQTGRLRWYAAGIAAGAAILLAIAVLR